jgi:hypothetical protein
MGERHIGTAGILALAAVLAVGVFAAATVYGGSPHTTTGAKTAASHFLIISPHTPEQCFAALDEMSRHPPKLLATMKFGGMAGDHTGYAFVTAQNEEQARNMLPESLRASANVEKVDTFTPEQIKSFHEKH